MSQIHAIFLRISAASLLVVMSARVYEALKQATLGQAIFWRSLWSLPVIVLYARVLGPFRYSLQTNQPFGHVLRGVMGLVAMALNFLCNVAGVSSAHFSPAFGGGLFGRKNHKDGAFCQFFRL